MTHPIENCPQPDMEVRDRAWTAERLENLASRMDAFPDDLPSVHDCIESSEAIRAYAATLRQQGEQAGGVVSEGVVERALMAFEAAYDTRVDGPGSPYANDRASCIRAALEAVAPLLRAPAEQGGRVDDVILREAADEALTLLQQLDPQHGITTQLQAALAQNAQVEAIPAFWAAVSDDGEIAIAYSADDDNSGAAARTECNQWINDHGGVFHLRPLYLHAERARVPDGFARIPDPKTGTTATAYDMARSDGWNACIEYMRRESALAAAPSRPEDASHD